MKFLIIGATRGIGFELLRQAVAAGHIITVLARDPAKLPFQDPNVRVLSGDILDPRAVRAAAERQEGVCTCIGIPPTQKPVSVFSQGMTHVLAAMQHHGIRRLIAVTGIGAGDSQGHGGFLYDRIVNPLLLKTIYEDKDREERIVMDSDMDWIIVRPGFLTNGPLTTEYRAITDLNGVTAGKISRADVAHFLLAQVAEPTYIGQTPLLTY